MKNKKNLLVAGILIILVATMLTVYFVTRPETQQGAKAYTVFVVHGNGLEKKFELRTDEEYLGAALEAEGLISAEGADPGMFHTVDGEKADWSVNQSYWALYVGEDYAMKGIYETPVTDGSFFKLVYTIG